MFRTLLCIAILILGRPVIAADFPLRVSENKRYLETADGKPFLVVGDTPWSLIAQLKKDEMVDYLNDRKKRAFNALIVNLIEHCFADKAPAKIDGVRPFLRKGDFTRPNPKYFDYAVEVVEAAHKRGLSVWLCPAYLGWGGGDQGFFQEIKTAGPKALRSYGKYVGRRFEHLPNVVWMPGGDYAVPKSERWTGHELALGIREGGAQQLMTAHGGQTTAVETFGDQAWLAIDNVYRYDLDIWRAYRRTYQNKKVRPFVLIESAYEGEHKASPARIRRQAWWAMLSGACGQFFGNNPIWYFDGPGFAGRSAPNWRKALSLAGSKDMTRLGAFFRTVPWHKLTPDIDDNLITAGGGNGTSKITAAITSDRRLAVLYIPSTGKSLRKLTLDLSQYPGKVRARWVNPARNVKSGPADIILPTKKQQNIRTPGDNGTGANDWVLVLAAE